MSPAIYFVKRLIDIVVSSIGLLLSLPLYPLLALAIKLESDGPVFYQQHRVNRVEENEDGTLNFITFPMIKFRTMMKDAEAKTGATLAKKNDMRITRIGGFLRKTRLDECPQFFNVLKGDMSIVGPRPERPELLENLSAAVPFFEERVRFLKPGITGLAQINLNYSGQLYPNHPLYKMKELLTNPFELANADDSTADDMRTKMLFDHAYSASLEKFSTFLYTEFSIILKTPWVMLFGKGR